MNESSSPRTTKPFSATNLALSGMLAALVFTATAFIKLPIPMTQGYAHLGDGIILLGAALLGWVAVPAAALGSLLSDVALGYLPYAVPTFLIKGMVAAVAVLAGRQKSFGIRLLLLVLAELFMVAGYFTAEWLVMGFGWAVACAGLPGNFTQAASGVLIAILLLPAFRRIKLPQAKRH